jgi:prolyl-tRNA synthetase
MAAAIEQNHDENGIIWPIPLAPFEVIILPLQNQDDKVKKASEELYESLWDLGVEALLDDRDVRAGVKFNDADLIGIPLRVAISKRTLEKDQVEFKERTSSEMVFMKLSEAPRKILEIRDKMLRALNGGD